MCRADLISPLLERSSGFSDSQKSQPAPSASLAQPDVSGDLAFQTPLTPGTARQPPSCACTSCSLPALEPLPCWGLSAPVRPRGSVPPEGGLPDCPLPCTTPPPSLSLVLDHGHHSPHHLGKTVHCSVTHLLPLLQVRGSPPPAPQLPVQRPAALVLGHGAEERPCD